MTGPMIDPDLDALLGASDPDLDALLEKKQPKKNLLTRVVDSQKRSAKVTENAVSSTAASFFNTLDRMTNALGENKNELSPLKGFGKLRDKFAANVQPVEEASGLLQKGSDLVDNFVGSALVAAPIGGATSAALAPLTTRTIGATVAKQLAKTGLSKATQAGVATAAASIPGNFLGNAVIDPEGAVSPMNLALTAFGSSIDGAFSFASTAKAIKYADEALAAAKTAEELKTAKAAIDAEFLRVETQRAADAKMRAAEEAMKAPEALKVRDKRAASAPARLMDEPIPTAVQAANKKLRASLEASYLQKLEALEPQKPVDPEAKFVVKSKAKQELDPVQKAQLEGMKERLEAFNKGEGVIETAIVGKGTHTAGGIGIVKGEKYITFEELEGYRDLLDNFATKKFNTDYLSPTKKKARKAIDPNEATRYVDDILEGINALGNKDMFDKPPRTVWDDIVTKNTPYIEGADLVNKVKLPAVDPVIETTWSQANRPVGDVAASDRIVPVPEIVVNIPDPTPVSGNLPFKEAVAQANIDYGKAKSTAARPTLRQKAQDRILPVRELNKETYDILSSLGATRKEAEIALTRGMALPEMENGRWTGKTIPYEGRPLEVVVNEAGQDIVGVEALLKAQRTLANPKKKTGMSIEAAQSAVANAPENVKGWAAEIRKVSDFAIDYQVAMGRYSAEAGQRMKDAQYAALGRMFNNDMVSNFRKARVGSNRASKPMVAQYTEQVYKVIEQTKKNYAWTRLAEQVDADPSKYAGVMEPMGPVGMEAYSSRLDELIEDGLTLKDAKEALMAELGGTLDQSDGMLIVFRNGLGQKYKVDAPMRMAVESMNPFELGALATLSRDLSIPLRETVAASLDLSLSGPLLDASMASMAEPSFHMLLDPLRGAWHTALKTPQYLEAKRAGAGFGGRFRNDIIKPVYPNNPTLGQTLKTPIRVYKSAIEALNNFIEPLSNASRMGLYLKRVQGGDSPIQAAAFSNDALGNWNRVGAVMRGWSMATEFGNVGIQGSQAAAAILKRAAKDPKVAANVLGVGISTITMPTIYFWAAAQGDEELNAVRKADNYDNWWWRNADGSFGKTKKLGWGLAPVFGGSIEAALDKINDNDPEIASRLVKSVFNSVMFNPLPISLQTMLGVMYNDRSPLNPLVNIPVVPRNQTDVDPLAQGDMKTSNLGKGLAAFGISPFITDFVSGQFLGADGAQMLRIITGGGSGGKERIPVLGRYTVNPGVATEGSKLFYDDYEKAREVDATLKEFEIKGMMEEGFKYAEKNARYVGLSEDYKAMSSEAAQMSMMLRHISADKQMTKEAKLEAEKYYKGMLQTFFLDYAKTRKLVLEQK